MSRAWYKPNAIPKLVESFVSRNGKREVQVWNTTCAVMNSGKASEMACTVLINPANPQLSGVSKFPYFPLGGPAPKEYPKKDAHHIMGHVSQWGGMEVGNGMMFAANVVDGLVHQLGGWKLAYECGLVPIVNPADQERCPVGQAVRTGPGGSELTEHFDHIVHVVPPFYNHHPGPEHHLLQCYQNSLSLAFEKASRASSPLLGAGCRGFPMDVALSIAGQASIRWRDENENEEGDRTQSLSFAIPDPYVADELVKAIEAVVKSKPVQ